MNSSIFFLHILVLCAAGAAFSSFSDLRETKPVGGGGKTGSICHFAFSLVLQSQDTQVLGKAAPKASLSHPSMCARMLVKTRT